MTGLPSFGHAWSLLRSGDAKAAAAEFAEVERLAHGRDIEEDAALYWRAVAVDRAGDGAGARTLFAAFLDRFPSSSRAGDAAAALGGLLLDAGDRHGARLAFERAARNPSPQVRAAAQDGLRRTRDKKNPDRTSPANSAARPPRRAGPVAIVNIAMATWPVRNGRLRARVVAWSLAMALGLIATPLGCSSSASTPATGVGGAEARAATALAARRREEPTRVSAERWTPVAWTAKRMAPMPQPIPCADHLPCSSGQIWSGGNHNRSLRTRAWAASRVTRTPAARPH